MIVSCHQPNYIPWLGFFDKIEKSDVCVLLDDVAYNRRGYCNRNKIRTPHGWMWLTVPVKPTPLGTKIRNVQIADISWNEKHWRSILLNYKNTKNFNLYKEDLEFVYNELKWTRLVNLNTTLIGHIIQQLKINTKVILQSDLHLDPQLAKNNLLIAITKQVGGDTYLAGKGGSTNYLDHELFSKNGITIETQQFKHPRYKQRYDPFIANLSVLDYLFCRGSSL